jgi:hypothetical protein
MMKKVILLLIYYVFIMSIISIIVNVYSISTKYDNMMMQCLLLSIVGIVAFILFILRKKIYIWFCFVWFVAQTVVIREILNSAHYDNPLSKPLFDLTLALELCLYCGWQTETGGFIELGINMLALMGSISVISIIIKGHEDQVWTPVK